MKKYSMSAILASMILCSGIDYSLAQGESPSVEPDREIIVMFQPGVVEPPSSRTSGRLDEFLISSDTLRIALENARAESIARLIPHFRP